MTFPFPFFNPFSAATRTWVDGVANATNATTYTFSNVNIGTAATDRKVVVFVSGLNNGAGTTTINSVTVGGITATSIITQYSPNPDNYPNQGAFIAAVPTGATATIVVTFSAGKGSASISVYSVKCDSSTPVSTASDIDGGNPLTTTISAPAGSIILAQTGRSAPVTWSGLTEDYDGGGNSSSSTASIETASGVTNLAISATMSGGAGSALLVVALQ